MKLPGVTLVSQFMNGTHLAVHFEKRQHVFFTNDTVIAMNPAKITLTDFSELCNRAYNFGAFARTLLYSVVTRYLTRNIYWVSAGLTTFFPRPILRQ
jgi:hypothetical protein